MTPLQKRVEQMMSDMRRRSKERVARLQSRRFRGMVPVRHAVPFGAPMLRDWLIAQSIRQTGEVWTCSYCPRHIPIEDVELDHVEPITRGGSFALSNLAVADKPCNQTKGEMSREAFLALMAGLESFPQLDRAYILKCLRTHGIGQRLRFPPKPKPTAAAEPGEEP